MSYTIEFAESVKAQLKDWTAHQRAMIFRALESNLVHEPLMETQNRKPLRPNPVAPWELRVRHLRVFNDVSPQAVNVIRILAAGYKQGNSLFISGKKVKL